jgi:hypothetical protein
VSIYANSYYDAPYGGEKDFALCQGGIDLGLKITKLSSVLVKGFSDTD